MLFKFLFNFSRNVLVIITDKPVTQSRVLINQRRILLRKRCKVDTDKTAMTRARNFANLTVVPAIPTPSGGRGSGGVRALVSFNFTSSIG